MPESEARHILGKFDQDLESLRDHVLMMSSLTERVLTRAADGLFQRDLDACNSVIADDAEIDALEKTIDGDGVQIMVRFQPMAKDLREVVSAMKVSGNLERVADQAVNIARRARKLNQSPSLPETPAVRGLTCAPGTFSSLCPLVSSLVLRLVPLSLLVGNRPPPPLLLLSAPLLSLPHPIPSAKSPTCVSIQRYL